MSFWLLLALIPGFLTGIVEAILGILGAVLPVAGG